MSFEMLARKKLLRVVAILIALLFAAVESAAESSDPSLSHSEWVTLGTMAGPLPDPVRSQPANALVVNGNTYIVDAGDGTAGRLAASGGTLLDIEAVFISHLHFDHTGGLPAILALRWQTNAPGVLTIYGPPGIKQSVEGIFEYMSVGVAGSYGAPGMTPNPANHNVKVVELADGDVIELDDFKFTAIRNAHYSWPKGSSEWEKYLSFAFKFELSDRIIVYTGDTGPSDAVVEFAKGADLYVSEMLDIQHTIDLVVEKNPSMPEQARQDLEVHLSNHHVTPEQVGDMAARAGVKKLVVTHMAPGLVQPSKVLYYTNRVRAEFKGEVIWANDLDRF